MENTFRQRIFRVIMPVIAIVAIGAAAYFYNQVLILRENPQAVAQKEATDLIAKVGRLVVLPTGETPTIATVSDPAALKDQSFFASAQKGDKVFIYPQAKKAILYSVTLDKILDVAPLNIGTQAAVASQTPKTTTKK